MKIISLLRGLLLSLSMLIALPSIAHHGWSEYEQDKLIKLTGKVTQSGYEHPHGFIKLSANGKQWIAVLAPPFRMENRGLLKTDLTDGTQVTVEGYVNRNKPDEMRAERITVANKTVELR
jgi:aspartyl/asparaginyl-tRNA synthetase